MNNINKIFILFSTSLFFGCSKEDEKVLKEPLEMTFDSMKSVSEMRVFTNGGIELNPNSNHLAIHDYLDRNYSLKTNNVTTNYQSKFVEPTYSDGYGKGKFTFYDNGKIEYVAKIISVKDLGEVRILKSSVTNQIANDPIITSNLFKYKFDTNPNGTYNYQYVLHGDERSVAVSLLYYKLLRYDNKGNLKSLAFGTVHNELNSSFIQELTQFDTLAVKEYRIKYSVK